MTSIPRLLEPHDAEAECVAIVPVNVVFARMALKLISGPGEGDVLHYYYGNRDVGRKPFLPSTNDEARDAVGRRYTVAVRVRKGTGWQMNTITPTGTSDGATMDNFIATIKHVQDSLGAVPSSPAVHAIGDVVKGSAK